MSTEQILRALVGWETLRTPSRLVAVLREEGEAALEAALDAVSPAERERLKATAEAMAEAGVGVLVFGSEDYPARLTSLRSPPPIVMFRGNLRILKDRALGVCGARAASEAGLSAAHRVGEVAAEHGWAVVAGNAAGVDQTAQNAAHERGGRVVVVLPEGIGRSLQDVVDNQALVLSQYPAGQPWSVGGAMARNTSIAALADALVVIEAGEQGGTRAAGETALRMKRPVFTIQFSGETPPGNLALVKQGAEPIHSTGELVAAFEGTQAQALPVPEDQLALPL